MVNSDSDEDYSVPDSNSCKQRKVQEVVRPLRLQERGEISVLQPQSFCLIFEKAPVWLAALRIEQVKKIFVPGCTSFSS